MSAEVVVIQSGDTSVVQEQIVNRVVTDDKPARIITSGMMPPSVVSSITGSGDIDITNLQAGSMLVYNTTTNKWVATRLLDQQTIEAGQF